MNSNWCVLQEAFVTSDEFGQDLEHVEVLQKKFDEFQKVSSFSYFSFGRNVDASEFFNFIILLTEGNGLFCF